MKCRDAHWSRGTYLGIGHIFGYGAHIWGWGTYLGMGHIFRDGAHNWRWGTYLGMEHIFGDRVLIVAWLLIRLVWVFIRGKCVYSGQWCSLGIGCLFEMEVLIKGREAYYVIGTNILVSLKLHEISDRTFCQNPHSCPCQRPSWYTSNPLPFLTHQSRVLPGQNRLC